MDDLVVLTNRERSCGATCQSRYNILKYRHGVSHSTKGGSDRLGRGDFQKVFYFGYLGIFFNDQYKKNCHFFSALMICIYLAPAQY